MMLYVTKKEVKSLQDALETRIIDLMKSISMAHITIPDEDRTEYMMRCQKEIDKCQDFLERLKWYD